MNAVEISGLIILTVFYSSFFIKMLMMKRHGIDSNLLGKGRKSENARRVERSLKAVTFSGACLQFAGVFISGKIWGLPLPQSLRIFGLVLAALGSGFFIAAMSVMKNNWRSGCDLGQNTSLVSSGLYKISRNPAFVGFDLLYLGCALAFPNVINLTVSAWAIVTFHRQILEEEYFLETVFDEEYRQYKAGVNRYLGRRL